MNRSILIVICDFLLVSLLLFSTPDLTQINKEDASRAVKIDLVTNLVDSEKDLAAVMRLALDDERKDRDRLMDELANTRKTAEERQMLLNDRERQVQSYQRQLETRAQEAARLKREQANLELQFGSAQTNLQTLSQQLDARRAEASMSQEQLAAMAAELRRKAEEAAALQQRLSQLAQSNQFVLTEKERLANQLQVAEVERRHATEQVVAMQEQVKVEREEKAQLAEGVKALATRSGQLAQEIRENRPLAANAIFSEFATNRVHGSFAAYRPALFSSTKERETETILVTDGVNTFALCHVDDTPLTLSNPGTDWQRLTGRLSRGAAAVPMHSLAFHARDPRVVLIPLSQSEARQLGGKVYPISSDPFKFQDAVLVGAREGYYGECRFGIDLSTPDYVKLDRNFLRGLAGKFNPSRGDLVFSKNDELLGVMANSTYCLRITDFKARVSLPFGSDAPDQRTGSTLSALNSVVMGMPFKLQ